MRRSLILPSERRKQASKRLIKTSPNNPFPAVKRFFKEKVKNTLFYKLFVVAAPVTFFLVPLVVQASFFSFINSIFSQESSTPGVVASAPNSQRIPLLEPAVNLDPNPAKGGGDITVTDGVALAPESGPAGTALDTEEVSQSSQISVYTVREGDTLSEIAELFDVTVNTIAWANDIQGRVIHPGQQLIILPIAGVRHTVEKGETLASIAKKYKGDADEIANYNELEVGASLAAGDVVIIPHGEIAPPPSSSSASSGSGSKSTPTAPLRGAGGPTYSGYYIWPVQGGVITQGLHGYDAVDIGAPQGTPIYAAADGTVIVARDNGGWNGGYGNYIVIQHNNGSQTLYAHATTGTERVSVGDHVSQGQQIASVGRTGEATGYHLHFEVRGAANPFGH